MFGIREAAGYRESAGCVKLVVANALSVADERGRDVLVLDQLDELIGASADRVAQRKRLGHELDETQLERVANEPGVSFRSVWAHLKELARSTLEPRSMTFLPRAGQIVCATIFLAK